MKRWGKREKKKRPRRTVLFKIVELVDMTGVARV